MPTLPSAPDFPPGSQAWRRAIEAELSGLGRRDRATRTGLRSARRAIEGVTRETSDLVTRVDDVEQIVVTAANPPTGVTVEPFAHFNANGIARGGVVATWSYMDEEAPIGSSVTAVQFEVWLRIVRDAEDYPEEDDQPIPTDPEFDSQRITATPLETITLDNLEHDTDYALKIRAISPSGVPSDFSEEVEFTTPSVIDVHLEPPSAPTLVSALGNVVGTWNGLLGGATPPVQFRDVLVQRFTDPAWETIGSIVAGEFLDARRPVGSTQTYRLVARDSLGQISDPSASASIDVVGVLIPDLDISVGEAIEQAQEDAAAALLAAAAAEVSADGKNRIFVSPEASEGVDPVDPVDPTPADAPTVASVGEESGTSLGSTNAQPLPSGSASGDLIVAFISNDNPSSTAISVSTGWELLEPVTQGSNVLKTAVAARILTGTGGDNILSVTGASQDYAVASMRIPAAEHDVTDVTTLPVASASGGSGNANPPSLDAGDAGLNYLWIAAAAIDSSSSSISAVPSGYTSRSNLTSASSSSSTVLRVASKAGTGSDTEDPGTFTNSSRPWIAYTVAVKPGPGDPGSPGDPGLPAVEAPAGTAQGDFWYVIEEDGSEAGFRVVAIRTWDGAQWNDAIIVADQILVPGSIGAISIGDGQIVSPKLAVGEIWANEAWIEEATLGVLRVGVIEVDMLAPGVGDSINAMVSGAFTVAVEPLEGALTATQGELDNLRTWFTVDIDGAHIGNSESSFATHMKSDRFEITDNAVVTSYWEAGRMVVPKLEATEAIVSNHKFEIHGTSTVIKAIG